MDLIPVPELVVIFVIAVIVRGLGMLWRHMAPGSRGAGSVRQPAERLSENQRKQVQLVASCVLLVIISIPLILGVVPPNGVYGFRTGRTQSSPAIWYAANAFMGWALSAAAVVSAVGLLMLPVTVKRWLLWATFLLPVFGAILASFAYLDRLG